MQKRQFRHHPIPATNQLVRGDYGQIGHHPLITKNVNGIEMGVLDDGTPYLTLRGLANVCGIDHAPLLRFANNWGEEVVKPRGQKIRSLLSAQGHPGDLLYLRIIDDRGEALSAFPDAVCMAILEYYAFEAGFNCTGKAKDSYRLLARKSFRDFIYDQCGYSSANAIPTLWKPFHDRASLLYNTVPDGYFGIFHAIQDLFITLGQNGIYTDSHFVPDISVGRMWSAHWTEIDGDTTYGARIRYDHNYPSSFPQAESNPQEPWAYPEMALGEFKRWFRENYIRGGQLERYLSSQASKHALPRPFVDKTVAALTRDAANAPRIGKRSA